MKMKMMNNNIYKGTNVDDWFMKLCIHYGLKGKDFLRDDCTGVNDMMNPNIIYAVLGMKLIGTWNMKKEQGYIYSGGGMNGFSKTKGKRKMVRFKI